MARTPPSSPRSRTARWISTRSRRFVDWQIKEGTHGLVPVGTTGESPTLSHEEHRKVVEVCIEVAKKRVPVIAGAGSNSTAEAIDLAKHAKKVGADAVLVVCPYYNRPTQEGMFLHFKAIADEADMPIIVYNVPGRTVTDISVETLERLTKASKRIIGIKDATANMNKASRQRHVLGKSFVMLSGEDATALGFNAHGGVGCISVTSNVAPRLCAEFQELTLKGDFAGALKLQDRLLPLHDSLFVETNPGPVKYAVSKLGLCGADCRLPLAPVTDGTKKTVEAAMRFAGVLN